jgi:chromosome segregation ATPase
MLNKLKDDILRLLKEDEEFRYAVVGLLGLQRLEEAIARLADSHIELKNIVVRLSEAQANMESRLSKVEEAVIELRNTVIELKNIVARQEERLTRVEDRLSKVEERLEVHDKKFNAILEELSIHRVKLEEHDKKFNEIITEIKDLRKVTNELTASMGTIGRRLGKDMEKMVLKIYRDQLMQLGIDPDKAKRFIYIDREGKYGRKGKEYEFDIVISNNHTDVLEVKTHTEKDDVDWFYENVEAIKELFDKPLRRKVILTVNIDEDALIKTDSLGINVIYGNIVKD